MSGAGGNIPATITINGNAAGAESALMSAADAIKAFQAMVDGLQASITALSDIVGANTAAMTDLSAALADTAAAEGTVAASSETAAASTTALGDSASAATGMVGGLTDGMMGLVDGIGGFIERAGDMVVAIAAWSIFQDVTTWVQQLSSMLFNLNVQTEKAINGWRYLFGSAQNATQLATWSSKFSLGIPFTRQDLLTGITTMGAAGMTPAQVEQFMPYLADIAATYGSAAYGGHGTTLAQSAQAVRMAREGMSRMLKYDLNISPEQLIPYGLVGKGTATGFHITDPNSLYRALENFATAKHLVGASGQMTQTTWWGGWSSFVDQIQNTLLSIGGTDLSGKIRPGSFFASIKQDLFGLLDWFGSHQTQLQTFADTLSKLVGTVVDASGGALGQFFTWLGRISSFQDTMGWISNVSDAITAMFIGAPNNRPGFVAPTNPHHHGGRQAPGGGHVSGGPAGGAGGHTLPTAHGKEGGTWFGNIDWNNMPLVGGMLHEFSNINWKPISQGLADLGRGWGQFMSAIHRSGAGGALQNAGSAFEQLISILDNSAVQWVGTQLSMLGSGLSALASVMQWAGPVIQSFSSAFANWASSLQQFINAMNSGDWGQIMSDLNNFFSLFGGGVAGASSGGGGLGGAIASRVGSWFSGMIPPGGFWGFGSHG